MCFGGVVTKSCPNSFVTPWTVACQAPLSMGFPRQDSGVGCHFLLQGIFQTHRLNPCLLHCRQILITEPTRDMYDNCIIAANDSISFFFMAEKKFHCIYISAYMTSSLFIHVNGPRLLPCLGSCK